MNKSEEMLSLEAERDELEGAIAGIKNQLQIARSRVWESGEYSDPNWFSRAEIAGRMKARRFNQVCRTLAQMKKEQAEGPPLSGFFMQVAKRLMNPESYAAMRQEAWALYEQAQVKGKVDE